MSAEPHQSQNKAPANVDPRMVARQVLIERSGIRRPAVSVVFPDPDDSRAHSTSISGFNANDDVRIQFVAAVHALGKGAGREVGRRAVASARVGLLALSVVVDSNESQLHVINRTAAAATGEIVVLAIGDADLSGEWLASVISRFHADPNLGVLAFNRRARPAKTVVVGKPLRLTLACRGDVWNALGGLDETYSTLEWALRDIFVRARAIGFPVPRSVRKRVRSKAADGEALDRRLFRGRLSMAPDRSQPPRRRGSNVGNPEEFAIYTTITGRYDALKPQSANSAGGVEQLAFLDRATAESLEGRHRGWSVSEFTPPTDDLRRGSRFLKANSHLALPGKYYSLWIDASIVMIFPFAVMRLAELFLSESDICVFRHHARRSVYDEAAACKRLGRDRADVIDAQVRRYRCEGFPRSSGLAELPVILRRHSPAVREFNEAWWEEIIGGSWRDQLSFNYIAWKHSLSYATFPLSLAVQNGLFVKFRRESLSAEAES